MIDANAVRPKRYDTNARRCRGEKRRLTGRGVGMMILPVSMTHNLPQTVLRVDGLVGDGGLLQKLL